MSDTPRRKSIPSRPPGAPPLDAIVDADDISGASSPNSPEKKKKKKKKKKVKSKKTKKHVVVDVSHVQSDGPVLKSPKSPRRKKIMPPREDGTAPLAPVLPPGAPPPEKKKKKKKKKKAAVAKPLPSTARVLPPQEEDAKADDAEDEVDAPVQRTFDSPTHVQLSPVASDEEEDDEDDEEEGDEIKDTHVNAAVKPAAAAAAAEPAPAEPAATSKAKMSFGAAMRAGLRSGALEAAVTSISSSSDTPGPPAESKREEPMASASTPTPSLASTKTSSSSSSALVPAPAAVTSSASSLRVDSFDAIADPALPSGIRRRLMSRCSDAKFSPPQSSFTAFVWTPTIADDASAPSDLGEEDSTAPLPIRPRPGYAAVPLVGEVRGAYEPPPRASAAECEATVSATAGAAFIPLPRRTASGARLTGMFSMQQSQQQQQQQRRRQGAAGFANSESTRSGQQQQPRRPPGLSHSGSRSLLHEITHAPLNADAGRATTRDSQQSRAFLKSLPPTLMPRPPHVAAPTTPARYGGSPARYSSPVPSVTVKGYTQSPRTMALRGTKPSTLEKTRAECESYNRLTRLKATPWHRWAALDGFGGGGSMLPPLPSHAHGRSRNDTHSASAARAPGGGGGGGRGGGGTTSSFSPSAHGGGGAKQKPHAIHWGRLGTQGAMFAGWLPARPLLLDSAGLWLDEHHGAHLDLVASSSDLTTIDVTSALVFEMTLTSWNDERGAGVVHELRAESRVEFDRWLCAFEQVGWYRASSISLLPVTAADTNANAGVETRAREREQRWADVEAYSPTKRTSAATAFSSPPRMLAKGSSAQRGASGDGAATPIADHAVEREAEQAAPASRSWRDGIVEAVADATDSSTPPSSILVW